MTPGDIELAMDDADIRPVPLHGVDKTSRPSVQLYFGPGFEERLELELEECVIWLCPSLFDSLTVVDQYTYVLFIFVPCIVRLVAAGKPDHISEEERLIRQKESKLFAELANPSDVVDSVSHLMESNKKAIGQQEEEEEEEITPSKPSKRTRSGR